MDPESDRWVRSQDVRDHLRDLLDEVDRNEAHVYVLRYDKPAAVIVPVKWYEDIKQAISKENQ